MNEIRELENKPVDLSKVHESLRPLYGDGMPLATYEVNGVTVRILGTALSADPAENLRRRKHAWAVADGILMAEAKKKLGKGA